MYGKSIKLLALALVAMLALSGCSLVKVDKAMDDATVVAEYKGGTITKGEANAEYADVVKMYESYGYQLTDAETVKSIKEELLNYLCEDKIVRAKADELGYTELTDEETAALKQQAQDEYDEVLEYYKVYFESDDADEQLKSTTAYLEENGYTPEAAEKSAFDSAWREKLTEYVTKDVTLTEEDILAAYNDRIEADKGTYESDTYSFEYAASSGEKVAWVPEGYRTVKHILLEYDEEQATKLDDLTVQLDDVNYELELLAEGDDADDVEGDLPADETDAAVTDAAEEEAAQTGEELVAQPEPEGVPDEDLGDTEAEKPTKTKEEYEADKVSLEGQIAALEAEALAAKQPVIDEINQKIAAGEDFDALIEQYGADPGMQEEPGKTDGYYVSAASEMWDPAFTAGAMALAKPGDVSAPITGASGIHIVKYIKDVPSGAVPLDEIRDSLTESALETAKSDKYDATVAEWVAAADVKTYVEKMD